MSTKKEKWIYENLICKLPHCKCMQQSPCSNHHYSDECFSTPDHSQSESIEWEKELKLLLENQGIDTTEEGGNQIFQEQKDLFSKAITTAVAKREKEIAEELEKLETDSYPAVFGDSDVVEKSKVLQILKH